MGTMAKFGVIMLVLALLATGVQAGTAPAVVSVDSYVVQVGQEFVVPVRIAAVSNLYGADVAMTYNPVVLQGVRVDHGYFLKPRWYIVRQGFYGPPPHARYALTQLNPTPPVSGSGVLVYVTFKALAQGESALRLYVELANGSGFVLPHTVQNGAVTVVNAEQDR